MYAGGTPGFYGGLGGFTNGAGGIGKGGGVSPLPIGGPVKQPLSGQPLGGGMPQGGLPAPTTPGQIPFSQSRMMQAVAGPLQGIGANGNGMGAVNGFGLGGMPPGMALQQQLQGRLPGFPGGSRPGQSSAQGSVRGGAWRGGYGGNSSYFTDKNPAGPGNPVFI